MYSYEIPPIASSDFHLRPPIRTPATRQVIASTSPCGEDLISRARYEPMSPCDSWPEPHASCWPGRCHTSRSRQWETQMLFSNAYWTSLLVDHKVNCVQHMSYSYRRIRCSDDTYEVSRHVYLPQATTRYLIKARYGPYRRRLETWAVPSPTHAASWFFLPPIVLLSSSFLTCMRWTICSSMSLSKCSSTFSVFGVVGCEPNGQTRRSSS